VPVVVEAMTELTHLSLFSGIGGIGINRNASNTYNMSNKYTYSVPFTEEELFQVYVNEGLTQCECADRFGTSQHVILRAMRKMGIPARKAAKRNQIGDKNASWKGGRVLINAVTKRGHKFLDYSGGYYMVKDPDHPNAQKSGYVFESVKVALVAAGREKLNKEECVHHINFNKQDNRPENLSICSRQKHREFPGQIGKIIGRLYDNGFIGFDIDHGYFVKGGDHQCQRTN
jgi:hypothetical protein